MSWLTLERSKLAISSSYTARACFKDAVTSIIPIMIISCYLKRNFFRLNMTNHSSLCVIL